MKLTDENYYSVEANKKYLSVSQVKDFAGTLGMQGCEARALARINGKYKQESSTALLVGSYIDSFFEGKLERWKEENSEVFAKNGKLKAPYQQAELIIDVAMEDRNRKWLQYMSGEKQVIMTGEWYGAEWKIKMDSYHPNACIVDLKIVQDIYEKKWVSGIGYVDFIRYWGYDLQAAVYQQIEYQNSGKIKPFYIAAVSKTSTHPRFELIHVPQQWMDDALGRVKEQIGRILQIKNNELVANRCERCNYCNDSYVIEKIIGEAELLNY